MRDLINLPYGRPVPRQEAERPPHLLPLGFVVMTPSARALLERCTANAVALLARHEVGDWGAIGAEDADANRRALEEGGRVLSVYELGSGRERLWIVTERDRSVTVLLLPQEH